MALSFDAFTDGNFTSGTSHTFSHTCTGSNGILWVHAMKNSNTDTITGATYNGVAMTLIQKITGNATRYLYSFYLINPASGAHNVVITSSGSTAIGGNAASYAGAKQSGQPDASTSASKTATSSPATWSITSVADNCWSVLATLGANNVVPVASTGSTLRGTNTTYADAKIFDSNSAITPAGAYSMSVTFTPYGSGNLDGVIGTFAPYVAASGPAGVKTYNGLAAASVKTVNGLAVASVKTWNGLA